MHLERNADLGNLSYDQLKAIHPETLAENAQKLLEEAKLNQAAHDVFHAQLRSEFGKILRHVDSSSDAFYYYYWATEEYVRRQKEILGNQNLEEFKKASGEYIKGLEDRIKAYQELDTTGLSDEDKSFLDEYRKNAGTLATEGRNLEAQKAELSKARLRKGRIENWREFPKLDDALIKELGVKFDSSVTSWDDLRTQAIEEREKIAKRVLGDMKSQFPEAVQDVLNKATLTQDLLEKVDELPPKHRKFAANYRKALLETPGYKKYSMLAAVAEEARKQNVPFRNWGEAIDAFNNPRDKAPRVTLEQAGETVTELETEVAKTRNAIDKAEKFITSEEVEDKFKKVLKKCGKSEREISTLNLKALEDAYNKALADAGVTDEQIKELVRLESDYKQKRDKMGEKHLEGREMHDKAWEFLNGESAKLSEADQKLKEAEETLARISNEPVRAAMEEEFKKDLKNLYRCEPNSNNFKKQLETMKKKYRITGSDADKLRKFISDAQKKGKPASFMDTAKLFAYKGKNYFKIGVAGLFTVGLFSMSGYLAYDILRKDEVKNPSEHVESSPEVSGRSSDEAELFSATNNAIVEEIVNFLLTDETVKGNEILKGFLEQVKASNAVRASAQMKKARKIIIDWQDEYVEEKNKWTPKANPKRVRRTRNQLRKTGVYKKDSKQSLLDTLSQFTLQEGLAYKDTKDRNIS